MKLVNIGFGSLINARILPALMRLPKPLFTSFKKAFLLVITGFVGADSIRPQLMG